MVRPAPLGHLLESPTKITYGRLALDRPTPSPRSAPQCMNPFRPTPRFESPDPEGPARERMNPSASSFPDDGSILPCQTSPAVRPAPVWRLPSKRHYHCFIGVTDPYRPSGPPAPNLLFKLPIQYNLFARRRVAEIDGLRFLGDIPLFGWDCIKLRVSSQGHHFPLGYFWIMRMREDGGDPKTWSGDEAIYVGDS